MCSAITSTRHMIIAMAAYNEDTTNIITPQPRRPQNAVAHEKYLNDGRKFGAELRSRARQAKFVDKYDSRKNTDVIWAISLSVPINNVH